MSVKLPKAPPTYDAKDQSLMRGAIERADEQNIKRNSAVTFLLLQRPDGTVGKLTVDNTGSLSWTAL